MKVSDDLTALVFELQRARSPSEKARALARAWRTVRGLSASERRLLAREVGFDGAEDLIEGLAGKSDGAFSPAAVLEALGKMKRDNNLSFGGLLAGLLDPDRRDDLLLQGMDLAADSFDQPEDELEASVAEPEVYDIPTAQPITELVRPSPESEAAPAEPDAEESLPPAPAIPAPPIPAPPRVEETPPVEEEPLTGLRGDREPDPVPEPSVWDAPWGESTAISRSAGRTPGTAKGPPGLEPEKTVGSVLHRLGEVRSAIPGLECAGMVEIRDQLETLPETWARRRALVAMIEAGVPADASDVLDLIEEFDRPSDRRWCLAVLALRGDLSGTDLERALEMLSSPAARRRVRALARV